MTAPWLDDGDVALYHGDAATVLRSLPAGVAQTCVTSPPYWGLRDYGTGSWTGGLEDCDHVAPRCGGPLTKSTLGPPGQHAGEWHERTFEATAAQFREECGWCGARRVDSQLGLEATPDAYVERLVVVMREVWRVLRADGTLWLNLGDSYAGQAGGTQGANGDRSSRTFTATGLGGRMADGLKPKDLVGVPWRVAFALQADGWYLRSDIIWSKPNPMPESVTDRPTKAHEYVFLLAKQPRYYYDADAIREPNTEASMADYASRGQIAKSSGNGETSCGHGGAARVGLVANGRNARSVWEIATQPTPEAHFATYPEALVRRCILAGTSEAGGCAKCGAPWRRMVDRVQTANPDGSCACGATHGLVRKDGNEHARFEDDRGRYRLYCKRVETTGWAASCDCGAPTRPQLVLDPFVGSGTTLLVARRHGRRGLGIDLSESYLQIAAKRTQQLSLLGEGIA